MADVTVRRYQESDEEGFWHVRAMTYNDGVPIPVEHRAGSVSPRYVGLASGQVAGVFSVLPLTCNRGNALLSCAGVAGVAVLPEKRHLGVGREMMDSGLRLMREDGFQIASLYAFRESFYRRSGYEVCGSDVEITLPTTRAPRLKPELETRTVLAIDAPTVLQTCLESFVMARAGGNLRDESHWRRKLGDPTGKTIYAAFNGESVEAYAILQHDSRFNIPQEVSEFVWSSGRGYRSILSLLTGISINKTALTWSEPSDSPFRSQFVDRQVSMTTNRWIMYRVLDVPASLQAQSSQGSGEFTIAIDDPHLPENCGPWKVTYNSEGTVVERADHACITLNIWRFTQALLGEPSLGDLERNGLVASTSAAELKAAEQLLPPLPVTCLEAF
jgi:predicted acetyltransferase